MRKRALSAVLAAAMLVTLATPLVPAAAASGESVKQPQMKLWYDEPAENWKKEALPIGNGHMGAMVFGQVDTERIQVNEKTLWTGGPNANVREDTDADKYGNKFVDDPAATMQKVVDRAFENFYANNNQSSQPNEFLPNNRHAVGNYQNFAETYIDFGEFAANPRVVKVTGNSKTSNAKEGVEKVFDGSKSTKYFTRKDLDGAAQTFPIWIMAEYDREVAFDRYVVTSGNDMPDRDPKVWTLYGSNDGQTFTPIDTQTDVRFDSRNQDKTFVLSGPVSYRYLKYEVQQTAGNDLMIGLQLSEITFENGEAAKGYTDYERYLDLDTGVTGVRYNKNGVTYTREMFANYPDNVLVYRVTASEKGALDFTLRPEIPHKVSRAGGQWDASRMGKEGTVHAENDTITLKGSLKNNGMLFEGQYKVVPSGGSMTVANDEKGDNGQITVKGADSAYIIIALGTSYVNDYSRDYVGQDPHEAVTERIRKAAQLGADKLYANHQADYCALFNRVKLNLGAEYPADLTTDQLLKNYKNGDYSKYLETLYFQFGRYLLISGSREGSLPTNLQGVWNDSETPMWQSDYHMNINLQMNYWPAMETNLAETAVPLVEYIDSLRAPGRVTFQKIWGIAPKPGETESGFVVNCSNGPLGFTGNINSVASLTATGAAFIGQNLYDYYAFTQDEGYLKRTIYPIMKELCSTYIKILEPGRTPEDKDKLYMAPSWSSEHGPWTVGTFFDQQLIYQIFQDTAKAADDLGVDKEFASQLRELMPKLDPVQVGKSGQIKEWQQEGEYNTNINGTKLGDPNHRHNSQLVALYPGNLITRDTQQWMEAAKTTLKFRGDGATGWSMGHKLNLWARTGDGNHAYKLLNNLLSTGTFANLFDYHAPDYFQIDGNFGGTAGITEMLLQSQSGVVDLLPALPDAWTSGSYSGLVARGNFQVDVAWADKEATSICVTSNSGNTLTLRTPGVKAVKDSAGNEVPFQTLENGAVQFDTVKGRSYTIETISRSEIRDLVNAAAEKEEIRYTVQSYQALKKAAEEAQALIDAGNFAGADVDRVTQALKAALEGLVARGPQYAYAIEVVKYAETLKGTAYEESSGYPAVTKAVEELIAAMERKDSDPAVNLEPYCKAVMDAINALSVAAQKVLIDDRQTDKITYGYPETGPDPQEGNGGKWYYGSDPKYTEGTCTVCKTNGSWFSMEFSGTRIQYLTEKAKGASTADVYVDGKKITSIDTYDGGNGLAGSIVFDSGDFPELVLSPTVPHTIKVVATGQRGYDLIFRNEGFYVFSGEKSPADKSALLMAAAKAETLELDAFEEIGKDAFTAALEAARDVIANPDADDAMAAEAAKALNEAMGALVKWTEGRKPTCTDSGWKDYYENALGRFYEDSSCTVPIPDITAWKTGEGKLEATGHAPDEAWHKNDVSHWHVCGQCSAKVQEEPHSFGQWEEIKAPTDTAPGLRQRRCTVCQLAAQDVIPELGHTHTGEKTAGKAPTCIEAGWKEYYQCRGCGKFFEDPACTLEIENLEAWKLDKGSLPTTEHTWKWVIDKEATAQSSGMKHQACEVCGSRKEGVRIPATGQDIEPVKPDAPTTGETPSMGVYMGVMTVSLLAMLGLGWLSVRRAVQSGKKSR